MFRTVKVLIFPCGAENAIELHDALSCCVNVEVWGASSRDDHGRYVFRNYIGGLPYVEAHDFIAELNQVIHSHQIDVMFPTHDTVALHLAESRDEIDCRIVMADNDTTRICREKRRIYDLFADCGFTPRVYKGLEEVEHYPVFLKPNVGEGGKHTALAKSREEAEHILALEPDLLLVEHLPEEEYTVDCFTDRHGTLRFCGARERTRIQYGISVRANSVPLTDEIRTIAETINRRLKFRGLWFFQLKRASDRKLKLLEISTRTAGTMCLYRQQGVNLPLLSVYDAMDMDVAILANDYSVEVDRALFGRYRLGLDYDAIYLDFDDTLVSRGVVNRFALLLLYQAAQQGKRVCLLTRHGGDIRAALATAKIDVGLFAEIRTLGWDEEKSRHIAPGEKAIFVDNSFAERKKVHETLGLPVFDVDAVSALLDWRT